MALILTTAGKEAYRQAEVTGTKLQATHMAVGNGGGVAVSPTTQWEALTNETWRGELQSISIAESGEVEFEAHVPITVGGWYIREVGLYAEAVLIAVASHPEVWKPDPEAADKVELVITAPLAFSDTDNISLTVDVTKVLASQEYVAEAIGEHDTDGDAHAAQFALYALLNHIHDTADVTGLVAVLDDKLGVLDKAADSAKLGGLAPDEDATPNTVALRNGSGDLAARYLSVQYINYGAPVESRVTDGRFATLSDDGYLRPNDRPGTLASLGLDRQTDYIEASAMVGDPAVETLTTDTNGRLYRYRVLPAAADSTLEISWPMPEAWDKGTLKAKVLWMPVDGETVGNELTLTLAAGAVSPGEDIDVAMGTAVTLSDAALGDGLLHVSDASAALTVGGDPALGDMLHLVLARDVDGGTTPMTGAARIIGLLIQYTCNRLVAAW